MKMTIMQKFFLENAKDQIERKIGYRFKNDKLLCQAFTRRSYSTENPGAYNNEVFEFYGDKALEFVVMKKMSQAYGKTNEDRFYVSFVEEGLLTEKKKTIVCKETLAKKIRELGLEQSLICGVGDAQMRIFKQSSVQEDLFESIIGAVAIDSDWNTEILENVVEHMLDLDCFLKEQSSNQEDYVQLVQQWYQKKYNVIPEYRIYNCICSPHLFSQVSAEDGNVQCTLDMPPLPRFEALGKNSIEARKAVAKKAYQYIKHNNLLISLEDEVGMLSLERAINQLQELHQKGYIEEPSYTFSETYDPNGNPVWECTCSLKGLGMSFSAQNVSKKNAKKKAAFLLASLYLHKEDANENQN